MQIVLNDKQYHSDDSSGCAAKGPWVELSPAMVYWPSGNVPNVDLKAPKYNKVIADKRRKDNLTSQHTIKEKMRLYNSSVKGNMDELRDMVEGRNGLSPFSITEEVSKTGYYWTIIHYASHFGHYEVLQYMIEFLDDHPNKYDIFNMQTTEGKSPLFCAIISSDIDHCQKQQIIKLWFDTNMVDLKLRRVSGEDLLQIAKKNNLYDFIVEFCLRED